MSFHFLPASQSLPGQVVWFSGNSLWPITFFNGMLSFCVSQAARFPTDSICLGVGIAPLMKLPAMKMPSE